MGVEPVADQKFVARRPRESAQWNANQHLTTGHHRAPVKLVILLSLLYRHLGRFGKQVGQPVGELSE